jgi:hypothetical protein
MIINIVVHPKGATHIQKFADGTTYFMKQGDVDGQTCWLFFGARQWIADTATPVAELPYRTVTLH